MNFEYSGMEGVSLERFNEIVAAMGGNMKRDLDLGQCQGQVEVDGVVYGWRVKQTPNT